MQVVCIYHAPDLDGHCSGAIVRLKHPNAEMIPMDYGKTINPNLLAEKKVYIVDFSFPVDVMSRINTVAELVWIDHHQTAIKDYEHFSTKTKTFFEGKQLVGIGACHLTWKYVFPLDPMPEAVSHIANYDVWNHQHPDVLPLHEGLLSFETDPQFNEGFETWERVFNEKAFYKECLKRGKAILAYNQKRHQKLAKGYAYETEFEGYRVLAINGHGNSKLLESQFNPETHSFMVIYRRLPDGTWLYSLFGNGKPNLGAIAKKYGGGGHQGAAGFKSPQLLV